MRRTTHKLLTTLTAAMLGLALLGGVASAALAPEPVELSEERGADARDKLQGILDELVADGTITEAQRDAILAKVVALLPKEKEEHEREERKDKEKRGLEPKLRFDIHRLLTNWLARAVEFIGLERKEVMERFRAGDTLLQIAIDEDKTETDLIDAISAPGLEKIAALDAKHDLTDEQVAALEDRLEAAVAKVITQQFPAKPRAAEGRKDGERGNAPAKTPRGNSGKKP